jgi:hypothetical protein
MPEAETLELQIYLADWIIEDGPYGDFRIGETRGFALEFWSPSPLTRNTEHLTSLRRRQVYSYDVSASLVFASDGFSVIDCGVLALSAGRNEIEDGCGVGDCVRGTLTFGIGSSYCYSEPFSSHFPPLVYEWRINSIEQDTTPYILSKDGRTYIRDESRRSLKAVSGTDKNLIFPDYSPEFVVNCSRLGTEPRRKL